MAQVSEILRAVADARTLLILTKGDIEHSVECVFNLPVGADGLE